jgi:hypothetical protein
MMSLAQRDDARRRAEALGWPAVVVYGRTRTLCGKDDWIGALGYPDRFNDADAREIEAQLAALEWSATMGPTTTKSR